jgi:hypothetical protein
MKMKLSLLRRVIREAAGGPLPMDLVRRTGGYGPKRKKDPWIDLRDRIVDQGIEEEFAMLVLDLGVDQEELMENFPNLAPLLLKLDIEALKSIAESL